MLADALLQAEGASARRGIETALDAAMILVRQMAAARYEPLVLGATGHAERLAKELKGIKVPKRKPVAQKPRAKGKTKGTKAGRRKRPKSVRQTAMRKREK